jgi:hypothetical protein
MGFDRQTGRLLCYAVIPRKLEYGHQPWHAPGEERGSRIHR